MVPKNNPTKFIDAYGDWWFIREFDYLPQQLKYYDKSITQEFMKYALLNKFDLFANKEEALEASYQIRKFRNIKPYSFDEKLWLNI